MMKPYKADILQMQAEVLRGVADALDDLAKDFDGDTSFRSSSAPGAGDTSSLRNGQSISSGAPPRKSRSG